MPSSSIGPFEQYHKPSHLPLTLNPDDITSTTFCTEQHSLDRHLPPRLPTPPTSHSPSIVSGTPPPPPPSAPFPSAIYVSPCIGIRPHRGLLPHVFPPVLGHALGQIYTRWPLIGIRPHTVLCAAKTNLCAESCEGEAGAELRRHDM